MTTRKGDALGHMTMRSGGRDRNQVLCSRVVAALIDEDEWVMVRSHKRLYAQALASTCEQRRG